MPEYLSPGVYIEEIPSGPVPIQGVSTSTTGFVGCTERGPLKPTLVTSWLEYQRWYGGLTATEDIEALGYLSHGVQGFFANGGQRAFIARVTDEDSAKKTAARKIGKVTISAIGPGIAGGNILVKLDRASLNDGDAQKTKTKDLFQLSILYYKGETDKVTANLPAVAALDITDHNYVEPTARETFDNLSLDPKAPNYAKTIVNGASRLIFITDTDAAPLGNISNPPYQQLTLTGAPKPKLPEPVQYTDEENLESDPSKWQGLKGLEAIREISLLCIPDQGASTDLFNKLTTAIQQQCERLKSRFGIIQFEKSAGAVADLRPPVDSTYLGVYYPWLSVQNPETLEITQLPPAGHMAGVYARTDIERGVHKAPANEILLGPILQNVGTNGPLYPDVTRGQQDILNPRNVNCIRDFRTDGRGIRVWGARTTSSDGQWRYVNVRRLFIFVEQSIEIGTQWVVFEPNDDYTWQRVISSVSGFLNTTWRSGALFGRTPQEAFFVKCDRTTMTQDDIDNGRLICLVGIAPVKPAEFVIFRFSQKTADAEN